MDGGTMTVAARGEGRRLVQQPLVDEPADRVCQLSTYVSLLREAHMLGKAHLGNLRANDNDGGHMRARVIQMTDQVLHAASQAAKDLEALQEDYVTYFWRQRGEVPPFNGAWGTLHVFHALHQQLRAEVDAQLQARQHFAGGRRLSSTLVQKRIAWNDHVAGPWQEALRINEDRNGNEARRQKEEFGRENAAATIIQEVWHARERRKEMKRKMHLQMRKAATKLLASSAFSIVADSSKLAMREQNRQRREMGLSVAEWEKAHSGGGSGMPMVARNRKCRMSVRNESPKGLGYDGKEDECVYDDEEMGDSHRKKDNWIESLEDGWNERSGLKKTGGESIEWDDVGGSQRDAEEGLVAMEERGVNRDERDGDARSLGGPDERKTHNDLKDIGESGDDNAAVDQDKEERRERRERVQKRFKMAIGAGRIAALAAPRNPVDVEAHSMKQHLFPVWKGGGTEPKASVQKIKSRKAHSGHKQSSIGDSGGGTQSNSNRATVRSARIQASDSMKRRMESAVQNFQAYGASLDEWVKENKHVLQLIHDDAQQPIAGHNVAADKTGMGGSDINNATEDHKELVAQHIMKLSAIWKVLKENMESAQETILNTESGIQQDGKHSKAELSDGTAMVHKTWRAIGDRIIPFQVALGNINTDEVMAAVLAKADKEVKYLIENPQATLCQSTSGEPTSVESFMSMLDLSDFSSEKPIVEKQKRQRKVKSRYLDKGKEELQTQDDAVGASRSRRARATVAAGHDVQAQSEATKSPVWAKDEPQRPWRNCVAATNALDSGGPEHLQQGHSARDSQHQSAPATAVGEVPAMSSKTSAQLSSGNDARCVAINGVTNNGNKRSPRQTGIISREEGKMDVCSGTEVLSPGTATESSPRVSDGRQWEPLFQAGAEAAVPVEELSSHSHPKSAEQSERTACYPSPSRKDEGCFGLEDCFALSPPSSSSASEAADTLNRRGKASGVPQIGFNGRGAVVPRASTTADPSETPEPSGGSQAHSSDTAGWSAPVSNIGRASTNDGSPTVEKRTKAVGWLNTTTTTTTTRDGSQRQGAVRPFQVPPRRFSAGDSLIGSNGFAGGLGGTSHVSSSANRHADDCRFATHAHRRARFSNGAGGPLSPTAHPISSLRASTGNTLLSGEGAHQHAYPRRASTPAQGRVSLSRGNASRGGYYPYDSTTSAAAADDVVHLPKISVCGTSVRTTGGARPTTTDGGSHHGGSICREGRRQSVAPRRVSHDDHVSQLLRDRNRPCDSDLLACRLTRKPQKGFIATHPSPTPNVGTPRRQIL